jgi:hypothetical protein
MLVHPPSVNVAGGGQGDDGASEASHRCRGLFAS